MRVYPIPAEYNPNEILKFRCIQFTACMEVIVVAQRGALISPDYKLTNMKNDIGNIFSGKGTYRSKQLPPYIPGILSSDILSKPWRHLLMSSSFSLTRTKTPAFGPTMTVVCQRRRTKSVTKSLHQQQPAGPAQRLRSSCHALGRQVAATTRGGQAPPAFAITTTSAPSLPVLLSIGSGFFPRRSQIHACQPRKQVPTQYTSVLAFRWILAVHPPLARR